MTTWQESGEQESLLMCDKQLQAPEGQTASLQRVVREEDGKVCPS